MLLAKGVEGMEAAGPRYVTAVMAEACAVGRSRMEEAFGGDRGWLAFTKRCRSVKARAPSSPPVTRSIRASDSGKATRALMLL